MSEPQKMRRIVLYDAGGVLVSAEANAYAMVLPTHATDTTELMVDTLFAKVIVTGYGVRWVEDDGKGGETDGVHFMPAYDEIAMGDPLRLNIATYFSAQEDFYDFDSESMKRKVRGFVLRVVTPHGQFLVDPHVRLGVINDFRTFRLEEFSPAPQWS